MIRIRCWLHSGRPIPLPGAGLWLPAAVLHLRDPQRFAPWGEAVRQGYATLDDALDGAGVARRALPAVQRRRRLAAVAASDPPAGNSRRARGPGAGSGPPRLRLPH